MIAVEGAATSDDVVAMAPSADPDTMRWHEAMRQPDRDDFKGAAQEEWDGQYKNENFSITHKTEVPEGETVLQRVWAIGELIRLVSNLSRSLLTYIGVTVHSNVRECNGTKKGSCSILRTARTLKKQDPT